jgi:hypothetical protein
VASPSIHAGCRDLRSSTCDLVRSGDAVSPVVLHVAYCCGRSARSRRAFGSAAEAMPAHSGVASLASLQTRCGPFGNAPGVVRRMTPLPVFPCRLRVRPYKGIGINTLSFDVELDCIALDVERES